MAHIRLGFQTLDVGVQDLKYWKYRRGALPQDCVALQSFLFALQWTILAMFSTNVTIFHHLISQAGWNRCNLSIYLSGRYIYILPLGTIKY